ncbi:MAG TPA: hypothetical protein GXX30_09705 [Firmicutes bacterium]|uniref:Uncharacterized protein n=1 Tax=Candidatus Fermentithermobacillus carboniphilus TaxID=3085328 RepID=A0AAT9LB87_9FIRM|nr:MAG: hypothetical protein IMF26_09855 [Candidatus Fermentithermobacillus carboniphilus]HHW19153.1 hypothetical protein [Candidatus Fermentithermobacillaceae bacterium]
MRRQLPVWLGFIAGMLVIIARYFAFPGFTQVQKTLDNWAMYSGAAAFLMGMINLTIVHKTNIQRRRENWGASLVLLIAMFGYFIYGLFTGPDDKLFVSIFNATISPLGSAMFSLLAFYMLSAAYRAFRMKTLEATILLAAGLIGILGNAPIGAAISPWIPSARNWMTEILNTAAMRAVTIGTALGAYAAMVRILLGIERSYLGGRGD